MTKRQITLLSICKKHIENKEYQEAIEVIDAILAGEREASSYECKIRYDKNYTWPKI